jgi:Zn-dependent oligopeptidase
MTLRQIYLGELDLRLHGPSEGSIEDIDRRAFAVSGLPFDEGTCAAASFGHLFAGYDGGYYGYLWSQVWGADLFSRFEREGIVSSSVGASFRREILEPGWSRPVMDSLIAFLGRQPGRRAFLRQFDELQTQ